MPQTFSMFMTGGVGKFANDSALSHGSEKVLEPSDFPIRETVHVAEDSRASDCLSIVQLLFR